MNNASDRPIPFSPLYPSANPRTRRRANET
jgi:hypothetical protein